MPKLPNVLDYGARESMRSNRLDMPGEADLIKGEAVANAAGVVVNLLTEKAERDNRMEFALAKDELIKADIQEREGLKDRSDFEAFDEDYTAGFQGQANTILAQRKLTDSDRALLSAESDLIRERGRVYAGDLSRTKRLDQRRGEIGQALIDGISEIEVAPPELQNEIMKTKLEMVRGAIDEGAYTEEEGVDLLQKFVTAASTASLDSMDPEMRKAELELAIAHREARGHLDREQIFNDEGSGSIGDFLPLHELKKMLEQTDDEIEIEMTQDIAFAAKDGAWAEFADPLQWKERERFIREFPGMTPEARKEANILNEQERDRYNSNDAFARQQVGHELANALYETDGVTTLDPSKLKQLLRPEREALEKLQRQLREDKEWADSTVWDAYEIWDNYTPQQKADWKSTDTFEIPGAEAGSIANIPWRTAVHADRARQMSNESEQAQRQIATGKVYPGLTQQQLLHDTLITTSLFPDGKPSASSDIKDQQRWSRISLAFNDALIAEGHYETITPTRRREILTEILAQDVYLKRKDFGIDSLDTDEHIQAVAVDPDDRNVKYLPITEPQMLGGQPRNAMTDSVKFPEELGGATQTPYTWIVNQYKAAHPDNEAPSDERIEHVWAIMVTEDPYAALARIHELASK